MHTTQSYYLNVLFCLSICPYPLRYVFDEWRYLGNKKSVKIFDAVSELREKSFKRSGFKPACPKIPNVQISIVCQSSADYQYTAVARSSPIGADCGGLPLLRQPSAHK